MSAETSALGGGEPLDTPEHGIEAGDNTFDGPAERDMSAWHDGREFNTRWLDAKLAAERTGERIGPGDVRIDGARTPWSEDPRNPERDRYGRDEVSLAAYEQHYRRNGFDLRALEMINSGEGFQRERAWNCGECARAVATSLNGQPETARPLRFVFEGGIEWNGERYDVSEVWADRPGEYERTLHRSSTQHYDETTRERVDPEVAAGFAALEDELRTAGAGAQAMVAIERKPDPGAAEGPPPVGHWFNAYNAGDHVIYLDGQIGFDSDRHPDHFETQKIDTSAVSWIRTEQRR